MVPTEPYDVKNFSEVRVEEGPDPGDPPQFEPCVLDVDGDGYITQSDIERIYDFSGKIPIRFDINGDGVVTEEDLLLAKEYVGTVCIDNHQTPLSKISSYRLDDSLELPLRRTPLTLHTLHQMFGTKEYLTTTVRICTPLKATYFLSGT